MPVFFCWRFRENALDHLGGPVGSSFELFSNNGPVGAETRYRRRQTGEENEEEETMTRTMGKGTRTNEERDKDEQ